MKIAHITDTHITKAGELAYGVDTRKTFLRMFAELIDWRPDFCVHTGDFLFREFDAESMEWLAGQFEKENMVLFAVPGNHDDPVRLNEYFNLKQNADKLNALLSERGEEGCIIHEYRKNAAFAYALCFSDKQLLFLDTSKEYIPVSQISFFQKICSGKAGKRLFFIHYPPVLTGHRFMDRKWSLKKRKTSDAFFKAAAESCPDAFLFCGHYHYNYSTMTDHYRMYITPSTFMQIDPDQEKYSALSYDTAWRKITIENDAIVTDVIWQKAASQQCANG